MSTEGEIKKIQKQLKKARENDDVNQVLTILEQLSKQKITYGLLKSTRIGKAVGKLRKNDNAEIAKKSSELVKIWKESVEGEKQNGEQTGPETVTTQSTSNNSSSLDKQPQQDTTGTKRKLVEEKEESELAVKKQKEEKQREETKKMEEKRAARSSEDRQKIVELLVQTLGGKQEEDMLEIGEVARGVEAELFEVYKSVNREYKTKYRSLSFNLRKNPELRAKLMQGRISVKYFCSMSPQEMASDDLKKERARIESYHLEAAKFVPVNQTSTDMFKCGKCGKRETTYYQMQTRRYVFIPHHKPI